MTGSGEEIWKRAFPTLYRPSAWNLYLKASRYLDDLWIGVKTTRERGLSLEEAQKTVTMHTYKDYPWPEILPLSVETVYRELERERSR